MTGRRIVPPITSAWNWEAQGCQALNLRQKKMYDGAGRLGRHCLGTAVAVERRVGRRRVGINAALYGKGEAVGMNRLDAETYGGGKVYFGKDVLGSVRGVTNEYGVLEGRREYKAELARFTTEDPVRDGVNWFAYANNDPVNYIDLWGLWIKNADGTYTAEAGDTLSGLSALVTDSGSNWERYEFAGNPLKTIDPRTLQIGSVINVDNIIGFSNADQAAVNIMPKVNPISQAAYVEYGGFTYQQNGKTYYTRPTTDGSNDSWDPKPQVKSILPGLPQYNLKSGQPISGWYHTHPNSPGVTVTEQSATVFSGWITDTDPLSATGFVGDMHTSDVTGIPGYMIDPNGDMSKYEPLQGNHLQYTIDKLPFSIPATTGSVSQLHIAQTNCGH
jgi:RHS repeat-associated protein